jgi:thiol-disulfide isomerase/thioredoxin
MRNLITAVCVLTVLGCTVRAQSVNIQATGNPLINQLCPAFTFDTLFNYKNEKLSLAELRGKFVIVDFWGTFCLPCIRAFPKLENWQKQFGDSLQILLVATDGYQRTKHFYETRKKANDPMVLPCAINRSMVRYFKLQEVSTYVWIDDKGYIRAITGESQLTEKNISDFIKGKMGVVSGKDKIVAIDFKKSLAEVAKEIDSNSTVYRSVLTGHLKGVRSAMTSPKKGLNRFVAYNSSIRNLYQIAFADSAGFLPSNRIIIESAQPEKITQPKNEDFEIWKVNNTYCYEITVPEAKCDSIHKMMRDDLQQLFGYNACMENRVKKCLVLKAEKGFRFLEDTTITPKVSYNSGGIIVTNYPFQQLVEMIDRYNRDKIIIDETGLTGKVDITIQAMMNDVDALNKELRKYGLSLHYEDRPVQMLVIKDPR